VSEEKTGQPTQPPSPDDQCALCQHTRYLHRDDGCHYLGPHGGAEHRCGGSAAKGTYRGARCTRFVEAEGVQS
jgi:hypothetical protein